jgi:hypothetical protein
LAVKTIPVGLANGKEYLSQYDSEEDKNIRIVSTVHQTKGIFDSQLVTAAATYTVVAARGLGGIALTDLVLSFEKKNACTLDIFFDDGVNTESIMLITLTDAPVTMGIPFGGHWSAWQGASLKITASEIVNGCISAGYYRTILENTEPYDEWIARR